MRDAAMGLAHAHEQGIIHRDLKPENIMLARRPKPSRQVVKVLDFGLAKLLGEEPHGVSPVVTGHNDLVGTPIYMSPERLEGHEYDGRSDVYSAGVILYEMLVGRLPFGDRDQGFIKIAHSHLRGQPAPPQTYRRDISENISALVLRAIGRNPELRPTAQQLRDELLDVAKREAVYDWATRAPAAGAFISRIVYQGIDDGNNPNNESVQVSIDPRATASLPLDGYALRFDKAGLTLADVGRVEINEAFSAQYLGCERELGLDRERANTRGGAVAIGHPLGASGMRLTHTVSRQLHLDDQQFGVASACVGGGQGMAILVERA